ncbi:MAG: cytochrome-c peroxidase [Kofleriaceae bacterium]
MRALAVVLLAGCATDPVDTDDPDPVFTDEERAALAELRYDDAPHTDPSNAYVAMPAARALGQRLFFATDFSGPLIDRDNDGSTGTLGRIGDAGKVACASCHVPEAGFVDTRSPHRQISLAAKWTPRRSPTLLDVAASPMFNWDGRRDTLWNQALGVMEASGEFNASRLFVAQQVFRLHRTEYEAVFGALPPLDDAQRFPPLTPTTAGCDPGPADAPCRGKPGDADFDAMSAPDRDAVTRVAVNTSKAIAAYITQLRCGPGRFDAWLDGDTAALTRAEQRGAALFAGRAGCATCHSGPLLTDGAFHNVGLRPSTVATAFTDTDDRGAAVGIAAAHGDPLGAAGAYSDGVRGAIPPVTAELEGAFKTPTLRCIANQPSFMHTAQIRTLASVVDFFDRGGDGVGFPGTSELVPLELSERERADLVAFLQALQGAGPDAALLAAP